MLNFDLDLSRSNNVSFESGEREKHDGDISDSLSLLIPKLFVKNISPVTAILTILDLWRLNRRPELNFDEDLMTYQKKS